MRDSIVIYGLKGMLLSLLTFHQDRSKSFQNQAAFHSFSKLEHFVETLSQVLPKLGLDWKIFTDLS